MGDTHISDRRDATAIDPDEEVRTRLTTSEVCRIARFSRATLWRRVASGRLPKPIDHAREALFCAKAIKSALEERWPIEPQALDVAIAQRIARMRAKHDRRP